MSRAALCVGEVVVKLLGLVVVVAVVELAAVTVEARVVELVVVELVCLESVEAFCLGSRTSCSFSCSLSSFPSWACSVCSSF